jgi:hypothetical protein
MRTIFGIEYFLLIANNAVAGVKPPTPEEGREISFVEKHMKRRKGIKEVPGNVKAKGRKRINVKEIMKGNRGEKRY